MTDKQKQKKGAESGLKDAMNTVVTKPQGLEGFALIAPPVDQQLHVEPGPRSFEHAVAKFGIRISSNSIRKAKFLFENGLFTPENMIRPLHAIQKEIDKRRREDKVGDFLIRHKIPQTDENRYLVKALIDRRLWVTPENMELARTLESYGKEITKQNTNLLAYLRENGFPVNEKTINMAEPDVKEIVDSLCKWPWLTYVAKDLMNPNATNEVKETAQKHLELILELAPQQVEIALGKMKRDEYCKEEARAFCKSPDGRRFIKSAREKLGAKQG